MAAATTRTALAVCALIVAGNFGFSGFRGLLGGPVVSVGGWRKLQVRGFRSVVFWFFVLYVRGFVRNLREVVLEDGGPFEGWM